MAISKVEIDTMMEAVYGLLYILRPLELISEKTDEETTWHENLEAFAERLEEQGFFCKDK